MTNLDYILKRASDRGVKGTDLARIKKAFNVGELDSEVTEDVFVHNLWVFYTTCTHTEFKYHCDYFAGYHGTNTIDEMIAFIDSETK